MKAGCKDAPVREQVLAADGRHKRVVLVDPSACILSAQQNRTGACFSTDHNHAIQVISVVNQGQESAKVRVQFQSPVGLHLHADPRPVHQQLERLLGLDLAEREAHDRNEQVQKDDGDEHGADDLHCVAALNNMVVCWPGTIKF